MHADIQSKAILACLMLTTRFLAKKSHYPPASGDRMLREVLKNSTHSVGFEDVDNISLKDSHDFARMRSVELSNSLENFSHQ